MGDIFLTINNCPNGEQGGEITLQTLNTKLDQIMGLSEELQQKMTALEAKQDNFQTAIDTEQEQVTAALAELAALRTQLADYQQNGATGAQVQEAITTIDRISEKMTTAQEDLANTIADTPSTGGENGGGGNTPGGEVL